MLLRQSPRGVPYNCGPPSQIATFLSTQDQCAAYCDASLARRTLPPLQTLAGNLCKVCLTYVTSILYSAGTMTNKLNLPAEIVLGNKEYSWRIDWSVNGWLFAATLV